MATVLLSLATNSFSWDPICASFRRLNRAFGSSHSASSAYQKWPTGRSDSNARPQSRQKAGLLTHWKFENRL